MGRPPAPRPQLTRDSLGGAMVTPLRDYAEHWFRHTALRIGRPDSLKRNASWVQAVADARPGFATHLRQIALEALESADSELVHRACAALAVVGTPEDISPISRHADSSDAWVAGAARTAVFEIESRAA